MKWSKSSLMQRVFLDLVSILVGQYPEVWPNISLKVYDTSLSRTYPPMLIRMG